MHLWKVFAILNLQIQLIKIWIQDSQMWKIPYRHQAQVRKWLLQSRLILSKPLFWVILTLTLLRSISWMDVRNAGEIDPAQYQSAVDALNMRDWPRSMSICCWRAEHERLTQVNVNLLLMRWTWRNFHSLAIIDQLQVVCCQYYVANCMQFTLKWRFSVALLTEAPKDSYSQVNASIWAQFDENLSTGSRDKQIYNR